MMDTKQMNDANAHTLHVQKQTLEQQAMEIELSLKELSSAKNAYRIVGSIMVSSPVETLTSELNKKKESIAARMELIDNQIERLGSKKNNG